MAVILSLTTTSVFSQEAPSMEPVVVSVPYGTIQESLDRIAGDSGYTIQLVGELPDLTVPAPTTTETINDEQRGLVYRIREVLDNAGIFGYVLVTDGAKKSIRIIVADLGSLVPVIGMNFSTDDTLLANEIKSLLEPNANLESLHKKQNEEYHALMNDPEAENSAGMKNKELWAMHAAQSESLAKLESDPNQISVLDGVQNQQLWNLHSLQDTEYNEMKNNPYSVDPIDGLTNFELSELHSAQKSGFSQDSYNQDPLDGISTQQLQELHRSQNVQIQP